jgi:hypothetical protein
VRGFPIRTSSDHGSFANSPRLIAGYHVLLRLLVPRHPPCALINLTTKIIQKDARVHCAVLKLRPGTASSSPAPTPNPGAVRPARHGPQAKTRPHLPQETTIGPQPRRTTFRLFPQDPTACQANPSHPVDLRSLPTASCRRTRSHRPSRPASSRCSTLEHHPRHIRSRRGPGQPHQPMTDQLVARCSLERR